MDKLIVKSVHTKAALYLPKYTEDVRTRVQTDLETTGDLYLEKMNKKRSPRLI